MILRISGGIKKSYAEALCLLFFPGAKFPENEQLGPDTLSVEITSGFSGDDAWSDVSISMGNTQSKGSATVKASDYKDAAMREKIAVGKAFLIAGKEWNGLVPRWGLLTGVRPSKVTSGFLREGCAETEAAERLSALFLTNPDKAALAAAVSVTEAALLKPGIENACSVYIAIPFCPSRCSYCSFVSYTSTGLLKLLPEYLEKLLADLRQTFAVIRELGKRVATVYIGGGTPTTLSADQLALLLEEVGRLTDVSALEEFTLEAGRPDTITAEKFAVAKAGGVSRVSVNPQSLNEDVLRHIGRRHTAAQFLEAYELAKKSGIRDINVDLIAGLETDTTESFRASLDGVIALDPENITVHAFSVKKAADVLRDNRDIYKNIRKTSVAEESVNYSQAALLSSGYRPYYMYRQKNTVGNLENVGYAKPGHEGLYNVYMMEEVHSIFGVGASAVTKLMRMKGDAGIKMERIFEPKYPYEYLKPAQVEQENEKMKRILSFFA